MNRPLKCCSAVLLIVQASLCWASSARQNCEQMYPPESYDSEERAQYISECMAATAEPPEADTETVDYEGTVEDFVESLPE